MLYFRRITFLAILLLCMSQITQAQLTSAKILSFADSLDNDSLTSHVTSFKNEGFIYYETYDPDKNAVKIFGYATKTGENKELYQIASKSFHSSFFQLSGKVFHGHNGKANFKFKVVEFDGINAPTIHKPTFDLQQYSQIYVGSDRRVYFSGRNHIGQGLFSFNGNSKLFTMVKQDGVNILGVAGDDIVFRDQYGGLKGSTFNNVSALPRHVYAPMIGNDKGSFLRGNYQNNRKIYYIKDGKNTIEDSIYIPTNESFEYFEKIKDQLILVTLHRNNVYIRNFYIMDPTTMSLQRIAKLPYSSLTDGKLHPYGSDKMVAFKKSGEIVTYNLSKKDSVVIDLKDSILGNYSTRYIPVSNGSKFYYFAHNDKTDKYYLCALSNDGKDVGFESSAFEMKTAERFTPQPLMLIHKKIYYFSGVEGGSALNVFAENAFELTFNCFHDEDADGVQDPGEININELDLEISGFALNLQSGLDGKIKTIIDVADYTIEPQAPKGWKLSTAAKIELKEDNSAKAITYNVGIVPKKLQYEIDGIVSNIPIRCGFDVWIRPKLVNSGTRAFQGECCITIDTLIDADSIKFDEEPDTIIGNKYVWKYGKVDPTHFKAMRIRFRAPGTQFRGRTLHFPVLYRGVGDSNEVIELVDTFKPEINCSYDPNDKTVWPNREDLGNQTLHDEKLTYRIRFQNTGTDTAFNIVVEDTLSKYLDWSTFKLMDYSHKVETKFYDDGLVKFIFKDILLPDSNVNEPESHGFINYTIKAKQGLEEWTEIKNTAYIYFDFNPAIVTNTTRNNMVSEIKYESIRETKTHNMVLVYPNPANNMLHLVLEHPEVPTSITLSTSNGKQVLPHQQLQNGQLDVSMLQPGIYFISIVQNEQVLRASFIKR